MASSQNEPIDLRDRALAFAKEVIKFVRPLQNVSLAQPIINQLVRSATSIGANFVEAKDSGSKKDFRNKVLISKKEAAETLYWLRLLDDISSSPELLALQRECHEIILILQQIIKTLGH